MVGLPEQLLLPTLSVRLLDSLVVFVSKPGTTVSDADWETFVQWIKQVPAAIPDPKLLVVAGGDPPSSAQRSLLNRELDMDRVRLAVEASLGRRMISQNWPPRLSPADAVPSMGASVTGAPRT